MKVRRSSQVNVYNVEGPIKNKGSGKSIFRHGKQHARSKTVRNRLLGKWKTTCKKE